MGAIALRLVVISGTGFSLSLIITRLPCHPLCSHACGWRSLEVDGGTRDSVGEVLSGWRLNRRRRYSNLWQIGHWVLSLHQFRDGAGDITPIAD